MRFSVLYAALVGLPVLALIAILRLGAGLEPPPSVGGVWRVAAVGRDVRFERLLGPGRSSFAIAQSGVRIEVKLGDDPRPALGRVEGERLWAERRHADGRPEWRFEVARTDDQTLTGQWTTYEPRPVTMPFTARRERGRATERRGH